MTAFGSGLYGSGVYGGAAASATVSDLQPIVLYSTDPVSDTSPTWIVASDDVRRYSVSRGRETELADIDPGRATIVLDDRARTYDPDHNSAIKPLNRWWIREQVAGVTYDVFTGYAEAYQEEWVAGAEEARTVVSCVDEMKRLATTKLPAMNPPRDTYADVVLFDKPAGFWRFQHNPENALLSIPEVGSTQLGSQSGATTYTAESAIVGEVDLGGTGHLTMQALQLTGAWASWDPDSDYFRIVIGDPSAQSGWYGVPRDGAGDAGGNSTFTLEMWFKSSEATPAANRRIALGPHSSGVAQWALSLSTTGKIVGQATNSVGTGYTATGATSIAADTWYHVALVVTGSNTLVYLNGVQDASASFTGNFGARDLDNPPTDYESWMIGDLDVPGGTRYFDELAIYNTALGADRIAAHYEAGALRGFPAQYPGTRVAAILDAAGSTAVRQIQGGAREMAPRFMTGQSALDELRVVEAGESIDAVLFIGKEGAIWFLVNGHRSVSPWNTVQATFDDTAVEWWYNDIGTDYSDGFIANKWDVTRDGGVTQSASDSSSITQYGEQAQSITDLKIMSDSDADAIATAMVAKYKDPMRRVTRIEKLATTTAVIQNLLQREIGDKIRIIRHPPGGGSAKDQSAWIQKIEVEAVPGHPRRFVFSVSPL